MTRARTGTPPWLLLLLLVFVTSDSKVSADSFGNLLDVSWRLPEPKGEPATACEKDIQDVYAGLRNMTLWANEMWDSSGRGPSGLLQGSIYQLGNFGECLREDAAEPRAGGPGPARQYCLVKVTLRNRAQEEQHKNLVDSFDLSGSAYNKIYYSGNRARLPRNIVHWGVCVPASCGPAELEGLLRLHFREQTAAWNRTGAADPEYQVSIGGNSCQAPKDDVPLTAGALLFIWLAAIFIGLVLFTTLYHWYLLKHIQDGEDSNPSIVKIYSLIYNLKQLIKKGDTQGLDILWGLRLFSIFFIIMDHRIGTTISGPISNREFLEEKYKTFSSVFLFHGDLLVDSFLVLSGLLSSFGLLRALQNADTSIPVIILYRYVRLVPAYAAVILFTAEILPLTGSGPLWPVIVEPEGEFCRQNWWTNMLMLSNYINPNKMCMVHSWYIPCDFHYFLVALLVFYLFRTCRRMVSTLVVLLLASILVPALITYYLQLPGTLLFFNDFLTNPREHSVFQYVYISSHTRAGPYLVGLLTGYLISKYRKPGIRKMSTTFSTIGAVVALGIMLGTMTSGTIFYESSRPYSAIEASFYAGLHRPVWGAALCILIVCGCFGHIPVLSMFLSWSLWIPLGKLVYGAYLIHMSLQLRAVGLTRQPYHVDSFVVLGQFLGDVVISFLIALVMYLTVEGPIKQIVHLLIVSHNKKKSAPAVEGVYSQTGHSNTAMDMEIETEAAPPTPVNQTVTHNRACILQMFFNKANSICEKNIKNIEV